MRYAALAAVLALAACGHEEKNLSGTNQTQPPGQPPAADPHAPNPHAGNPSPLNPHGPGSQLPPDAAPAGAAPVAWTVPAGWKETPRSSSMRVAQFDVGTDAAGQPVQCIVFGGIGGTDEMNFDRWIGEMGAGAKEKAVLTDADHDGLKIKRLEVRGSHTNTMRPDPKPVADATMLAAIVDTPGGKLHVKFVGSKSVVDPAAKAFDEFLASMRPK